MAPASTPPPPGSMTVPPLFGWETIIAVLVLLIVVAVAFFALSATGRAPSGRSEFQAWLEARSARLPELRDEPGPDGAYEPSRRGSCDGDMSLPRA